MSSNAAQRERDFVAWIRTQRQIVREQAQRPITAAQLEAVPVAASSGGGGAAREGHEENYRANKVPDGLLVAAAVLGACVTCPICAAAGGRVVGFLGGFAGALLGELAVLGIAQLLKAVLSALQ